MEKNKEKQEVTMKTGVVDVGGGLRGIYAAGVLDYCMDHGIRFDLGIGVSTGSANLASYHGVHLRIPQEPGDGETDISDLHCFPCIQTVLLPVTHRDIDFSAF